GCVTYGVWGLDIRFPREGFFRFVEPASDALKARFPSVTKEMSLVHVSVKDASLVKIRGFGMPFKNNSHPCEDWLLGGRAITRNHTLLDILQADSLKFVVPTPSSVLEKRWNVSELQPPFSYPYGTTHYWDKERYERILPENKGHQFVMSWSYHDDNAHLAALTQSQVQDMMWLDTAAREIRELKFPTYSIESQHEDTMRYFAIMSPPTTFKTQYESALQRLVKDDSFQLLFFNSPEDDKPSGKWDAKVVDN
ncbi:hypothetical protein FDECE_18452, partial [Fusarium decemcellulare]